MRALVKRLLFGLGLARALNRARNRDVLTVLMFHRVLSRDDPRAAGANPTYTAWRDEFAAVLDLLAAWYSVIDLARLERIAAGEPAPPCPLLITFDDGWRDNFDHALPELAARGLPALLFVATDYVGDARGFWQERVFDHAMTMGPEPGRTAAAADARIRELALLERPAREARLAGLAERPLPRLMADADELHRLEAGGVAIGGHGASHEPFTSLPDPLAELAACRAALARHGLGGERPAFSFPHGRCTPSLVEAARQAGFGLCFTSAAHLTPPARLGDADGIGRLGIDLRPMRTRQGFDIAAFAFSLLTLPHKAG